MWTRLNAFPRTGLAEQPVFTLSDISQCSILPLPNPKPQAGATSYKATKASSSSSLPCSKHSSSNHQHQQQQQQQRHQSVQAFCRPFVALHANTDNEKRKMVCDTCEKKLGKLCVPDKWKEGSRNVTGGAAASSSGPPGSINKLAEKRKARLAEAGGGGGVGGRQCRICKVRVMDVQRHYCNGCAYKKAICAMCGKKVGNTKLYKMSSK